MERIPEWANDGRTAESIVELLEADDARVTELFDRLAEKRDAPQSVRDRLLARICEMLAIQRLAEEEVLYPALRSYDDKLVFGFLLVGHGISMRISEIRDSTRARPAREASLVRLKEMIRRNLAERRHILLPFVLARLSRTQLRWLGDDYAQRKLRLAAVAGTPRSPRLVGTSSKPTGLRNTISLALWRQRRGRDDAHPR